MKTILAAAIFLAFTLSDCVPPHHITKVPGSLKLDDKELIPEGIAVDPITHTIYLSSIHKNKIVAVDVDGKTRDVISSGEQGFLWGLGMKVTSDGKTLWACTAGNGTGETYLFAIDLRTEEIKGKFTHDSANFFNDLVIHPDGDVYLTDTDRGSVFRFRLSTGKMEEWFRSGELMYANGIELSEDGNWLFVASGSEGLKRIQIGTKNIYSMSTGRPDYAIDGLLRHGNRLIGIHGWPQDRPETHRVVNYWLDANLMVYKRDTLIKGQPLLDCPTTAAIYKNSLLIIAKTNLGVYNRAGQKVESIKDSLQAPSLARLKL